jgi:hypothetical protein
MRALRLLAVAAVLLCAAAPARADDIYQSPNAFLAEAFPALPAPVLLDITPAMRGDIERILGHTYRAQRVRTWREGGRSVWILEEIGKYRPITVGLIVNDGAVEALRVLIYRESHGWEVRHDFFTAQFKGMTLNENNRLSARVDGISGATLSVNALQNLARLALYFDKHLPSD